MLVHWVKVIWAKDCDFWTTQGWEINFFQTKHWHVWLTVHRNIELSGQLKNGIQVENSRRNKNSCNRCFSGFLKQFAARFLLLCSQARSGLICQIPLCRRFSGPVWWEAREPGMRWSAKSLEEDAQSPPPHPCTGGDTTKSFGPENCATKLKKDETIRQQV